MRRSTRRLRLASRAVLIRAVLIRAVVIRAVLPVAVLLAAVPGGPAAVAAQVPAALQITEVVLQAALTAGDQVDARIEISNAGATTVAEVVVRLDLPVGVGVSGSYLGSSACGAAPPGTQLVCRSGAALAPGASMVAVVSLRNDSIPAGTAVEVPVAVGSAPDALDPPDDASMIRVTFSSVPSVPSADLALVSATASAVALSSSMARIDVVVGNGGPQPVRDVAVTYVLPAGVVAVSAHVALQPCEPPVPLRQVCVHAPLLEPGAEVASGVMLVNVGLPAGTVVEVEVLVGGTGFTDRDPGDDRRVLPVAFEGGAVPTLAGTDTAELALVADEPVVLPEPDRLLVRWTLFSTGPATAPAVELTMRADPPAALVDASIGGGGPCGRDGIDGSIRCRLVDPLVPGFGHRVEATVDLRALPAGSPARVEAAVSSALVDLELSNNRSSVLVPQLGHGAAAPPAAALPRSGAGSWSLVRLGAALCALGAAVHALRIGRRWSTNPGR